MMSLRNIPRRRTAFTLIELLVVIGIIALLATFTVFAVRGIAKDARLSSATNTVTAVLSNARSLAMKENSYVMVAFRARLVNDNRQVIEAVTCEYSGSSYEPDAAPICDRFIPVTDVPVRELPEGVKIAVPMYRGGADLLWVTNSDFIGLRSGEQAGAIIGVLYGPDGTLRMSNAKTDSVLSFIDFNDDEFQHQGGTDFDPESASLNNAGYCDFGSLIAFSTQFACQAVEDDEPYITIAPFLAVYDDEEAREVFDPSRWDDTAGGSEQRVLDLTTYITANADRVHFNRYTGVVMK